MRTDSDADAVFVSSLLLAPDLVEMRELFPELDRLWNAVHADFWRAYLPAAGPPATRISLLVLRARDSGYRLMREPLPPHLWTLRAADDGEHILGVRTLDEIEHWLDT
ncbi:hypothetical protein [Nocardia blacklockiae]|uniref:hypothetical protein n=1 Tax=Nocardia blacklockiae TaxID=480036 RepID=UPI001893DB6B|nr:hypothetical protein [Nocardia blacklockiae]MBF6172912.1 hypothetical protein [Nocardia blacklockiae]